MSTTSKQEQPQKQYYSSYSSPMSQIAAQTPPEIQALLDQQEEINRKLEGWRKEQEEKKLREQEKVQLLAFAEEIKKKRSFSCVKYDLPPPKRLKRHFHNINVVRDKEKELAQQRAVIKEELIKDIHEYLKKKKIENTLNLEKENL